MTYIEGPEHGTPEWHEARRLLVTSTDAPILMGCNPYETVAQRFYKKLNGVQDPVNKHMERGIRMEPKFIEWDMQLKGVVLHAPKRMYIKDHLSASPDAIGNYGNVPWEYKCPEKFKTKDEMFSRYGWQVTHQMLVLGARVGILVWSTEASCWQEYRRVRQECHIALGDCTEYLTRSKLFAESLRFGKLHPDLW